MSINALPDPDPESSQLAQSTESALRAALEKLLEWASKQPQQLLVPEIIDAQMAIKLPPTPEAEPDTDMVEIVPSGAQPIFHLPDRYKSALIGHTVDARRRPRFVYSLCKMVLECQTENKCSERDAQDKVFNLMLNSSAQWKDQCPVFCDDTVSQKSRIIKPNRF